MTRQIFFAGIFSILVFCRIAFPGEAIDNTLTKTLIEASGIHAGLCVHLGATDGKLDIELGKAGKFLVHGLAADQETVDKARVYIQEQKLYGQVSVERGNFSRLLYADNLVNLVIVENLPKLRQAGLKIEEIKRVLCPKGVLIIEASLKDELTKLGFDGIGSVGTDLVKAVKPRPKEMDEWTHSHHGPDGNAVSKDMLKPVNGVRWIAGPSYMTTTTASMLGVPATANGRLFQPIGEEESFLVARDAFNGMLLWKHPVKAWDGNRMNTSPSTPSILVAQDNRVFVLLDKKPCCLDAATGKILKSYDKILSDCEEINYQDDSLILTSAKEVCCIDVKSDTLRWRHAMSSINLVIGDGKLFIQDISKSPYEIVSLDLNSGKQIWRKSLEQWGWVPGFSNYKNVALCLYQKGMLFLAIQKDAQKNAMLHAISAKDGAPLWNFLHQGHYYGFADFKNVFFVDDLVWVHGGDAKVTQKVHNSYSIWYGLNPATGKVEKEIEYTKNNKDFDRWRCSPDRVTARYFLIRSIGFLDRTDGVTHHFWGARNACGGAGILPGNGLIYTFPHGCTCHKMIRGFLGLAFNGDFPRKTAETTDAERLQRGPSFEKMTASSSLPDDWTCFRHDIARSSRASSAVPQDAKLLWTLDVAKPAVNPLAEEWAANPIVTGPITAPTIAQGKIFLALPDANQVAAFDAQTQKLTWQFTAGGRVDTPPTIHEGLCIFGSCDGWVYCLDARDGKLVWRFLAATEERRITVRGQLESIWPVFGSILVIKDVAYFSAGRSEASDGGLVVYAVEPKTGKLLWKVPLFKTGITGCNGFINDLLVSDGEFLYLCSKRFDLKTGQVTEMHSESKFYDVKVICDGAIDMLDASWRTFGGPFILNFLPFKYYGSLIKLGELLAIGNDQIFGFRLTNWNNQPKPILFAWKKGKDFRPPAGTTYGFDAASKAWGQWSVEVTLPMLVETMLIDGDTLWVAGATDHLQRKEGFLWALSKTDGKILNKWKLLAAPPIYEGLAAANGRLYLSTQDGKLLCFGK